MLRVFSVLHPLLILVVAIGTALPPGPEWLLRWAGAVFLCGFAVRWIAIDRAWLLFRQKLGVSETAGLAAAMALYAAAGLVAIAAAFMNLPAAGAVIVSWFLLAWSTFWIWALQRIVREHHRSRG